jgi:drug/metabolite transporter (DMT)-like permease
MQFAGLSFGFGQVEYRRWKRSKPQIKDHQVFALLLVGGFVVAGAASAFLTDRLSVQINADQCRVLLYLGLVASGIGFFLWNKGAALCCTGTLAAFNNAVVPLAMACSIFIFGELDEVTAITLVRLSLGALCITGAVFVAEYTSFNGRQYLKD